MDFALHSFESELKFKTMKKAIQIIVILLISANGAIATEVLTQTIRGIVVDAITGFPLIGANIILLDSNPLVGAVTDLNGNFALKQVPVGRRNLMVSYVGYHEKILPNLLLTSGKEIVLDIQLEENALELEEVVVKAGKNKDETINEMAIISARTFSVEETERFAGSLGDPARMVANYAGVMTQNDSRNDIIIRGNSPMGVLWRLEGVEIPNPNHFGALGTTGGPVSMVNNNLLANSDFLTGAFPAEYGNATAGAFDLNLRSGNKHRAEFTGQIGFNGFEGGIEGPFMSVGNGQKASYLANFRYSTLDVMSKLGLNFGTGAAIPQYKDLTFLVDVPGTKLGRFRVFGLLGNSFIQLGREAADTLENSYNGRGAATDFGSGLGVVGFSNTFYFNEKTRLKTTLSFQQTNSVTKLDSLLGSERSIKPFLRSEQQENKISFSSQFRQKINARNNYSFGMILDQYTIDYIDSLDLSRYDGFITRNNIAGNMFMMRGYGQYQHKFNDELMAYSGIHMLYFGLNGELVVEPRLGMRWQFADRQSMSFGYGLHSQIQPKSVYYYETYEEETGSYHQTNTGLGSTRSNHLVLGYDYLFAPDFRLKMETYYQYLYNIPVKESFPEFSLANAGDFFGIPMEDSLVNRGTGTNYGIEMTVEKFLNKGYYFLFTASVFDSKYKGYDGVERNTAFNGNYVFNLLGGYEHRISEKLMLTIDLKAVLAGGRRFVPINLEQSILLGSEEVDWNRAYESRYDDYFRTDLRIGLKKNNKRYSQEWGVDLQNLTGFQSIFMQSYDPDKAEVYTVYQQGFYPMFLYRINF